MKNAVIYTRSASPNEQGINAQLELCREYARTHGYNVVAEFSDNGKSGMTFNRPAFTAMNASRDKWQTLLIYRTDKLSRNHSELCKYRKTLRNEGKQIVSISEPFTDEMFALLEDLQENYTIRKREVHSK